MNEETLKLLVAITDPGSTALLRGQLRYMQESGFEVTLLCAPGSRAEEFAGEEGVALANVPMVRNPAPASDIRTLWQCWRTIRRLRPTIVNAGTPKAGLMVILAAWLAGVPVRLYTLRGLRYQTESGSRRVMLKLTERLAAAASTRVISISNSVARQAILDGLVAPSKSIVLGQGSSNGVDTSRFSMTAEAVAKGRELHRALGLPEGARVVGYVGRLAHDKGVVELQEAWQRLKKASPEAYLLVVGSEDPSDPVAPNVLAALRNDARVRLVGGVRDPVPYFAAMEVVALPTYREGFGNVLIEAGAMGLPVVATSVAGCIDAVVDGVTGTLVPVGDSKALADAVQVYLEQPLLRQRHGQAARKRIERNFRRELVWESLKILYLEFARSSPR